MRKLILLRGLPGAGKSSIAQTLGGSIEADDFMVDTSGKYCFDPKKLSFAHRQCEEMAKYCMERGEETVVISNTFTTEKELDPYYNLAERYGYQVSSLIVENRHDGKSIHNVPAHKINMMRNRFEIKL